MKHKRTFIFRFEGLRDGCLIGGNLAEDDHWDWF